MIDMKSNQHNLSSRVEPQMLCVWVVSRGEIRETAPFDTRSTTLRVTQDATFSYFEILGAS